MKQAIRTEQDAIAYLTQAGRADLVAAATARADGTLSLSFPDPCGRCGGSGFGSWLQDGGRCYDCGGRNTSARRKVYSLKSYAQSMKRRDSAAERKAAAIAAERAFAAAQGEAFLAARPELAAALKVEGNALLADLAARLSTWGSLSDAQVALAIRVAAEHAGRAFEVKVAVPAGRATVQGLVLSVKESFGPYGETLRMTVKVDTGAGVYLINGTVPRDLARGDVERNLKGATVRFTATLEAGREPHFGFFKRPTKAEVVAPRAGAAAPAPEAA